MNLVLVRKRSEKEHTSAHDKFGLNASQFARKIHQPHIIPFICDVCANPIHIYFMADKAKWHQSLENQNPCEDCSYMQLR